MSSNHEIIRALAFDLFLERNGADGSPLEDWLKAEKEVERVNAVQIEKIHFLKVMGKRRGEVPLHAGKKAKASFKNARGNAVKIIKK